MSKTPGSGRRVLTLCVIVLVCQFLKVTTQKCAHTCVLLRGFQVLVVLLDRYDNHCGNYELPKYGIHLQEYSGHGLRMSSIVLKQRCQRLRNLRVPAFGRFCNYGRRK